MPDPAHGPASGDVGRATPEVQKYRPRACQSCARSKMRCIWPSEPGASPCHRCSKIKSPCTLPEINPRRRRGPSTRVGQLEEKIDGIMSLLNASQQIQQNSPSSSGQTPPSMSSAGPITEQGSRSNIQQLLNPNLEAQSAAAGAPRPTEGLTPSSTSPSPANLHPFASLVPPQGPEVQGGAPVNPGKTNFQSEQTPVSAIIGDSIEIVKGFRVTFLEADRALNVYRSLYSPYFPFAPIPVMMTAYDLYARSPFLFRSIVAVTTPQLPPIQAEYRLWFREYVAQHVVVNNEKRLEVLQAILIHLAWGDYYFLIEPQATNLIQIAAALVIDLGLNRWPLDFGKARFLMLKEAAMSSGEKLPWNKQHTLDEMRACLGTFYVTSLCSSLFRRHQTMSFNSYLSKCCEVLADAQEYDSDKFLLAMVKIQRLLTRGADIIPHSDDPDAERHIQYTPAHMALTSIQKELAALMREQPPEVECNALLWTHYHGTMCRLFEPAMHIRPMTQGGFEAVDASSRTAALWQCLHSARDFFSAFLAVPPQNLACVPFHSAHLSFCLLTATRLMFLGEGGGERASVRRERGTSKNEGLGAAGSGDTMPDDPDWNAALAREAVALDAICDRIADFFDEADRICVSLGRRVRYLTPEKSILAMYRDRIRWIRDWYVHRTRPGLRQAPRSSTSGRRGEDGSGRGVGGGASSLKDAAGSELGSGGGPTGSRITAPLGQPMDVDYSASGQVAMASELDEGFWQAMVDWGWNVGMDLMDV